MFGLQLHGSLNYLLSTLSEFLTKVDSYVNKDFSHAFYFFNEIKKRVSISCDRNNDDDDNAILYCFFE